MAADPEHRNLVPGTIKMRCHNFHVIGIALSQLGSVCFVTGSVLYRPLFYSSAGATMDCGTTYYIVGSVLYTMESVIHVYVTFLKHSMDDYLANEIPDDKDTQ